MYVLIFVSFQLGSSKKNKISIRNRKTRQLYLQKLSDREAPDCIICSGPGVQNM